MAPLAHFVVDLDRLFALRSMRDSDGGHARSSRQRFNCCRKPFLRQRIERQAMDERRDAHGVVPIAGEKYEPNEASNGICHELCISVPAHAVLDARASKHSPNYSSDKQSIHWINFGAECELDAGCKLFPDIPSVFLAVSDCELDQLGRGLDGWERAPRLDRFPKLEHPSWSSQSWCPFSPRFDKRVCASEERSLST